MVVVVILVFSSVNCTARYGRPEQARRVVLSDILAIENAMDMYQLDNGQYPTQKQGLNALITKPVANQSQIIIRQIGYLQQPR